MLHCPELRMTDTLVYVRGRRERAPDSPPSVLKAPVSRDFIGACIEDTLNRRFPSDTAYRWRRITAAAISGGSEWPRASGIR